MGTKQESHQILIVSSLVEGDVCLGVHNRTVYTSARSGALYILHDFNLCRLFSDEDGYYSRRGEYEEGMFRERPKLEREDIAVFANDLRRGEYLGRVTRNFHRKKSNGSPYIIFKHELHHVRRTKKGNFYIRLIKADEPGGFKYYNRAKHIDYRGRYIG